MKKSGLTDSPAIPSATANHNPNNRIYLTIDPEYGKSKVR